MIVFLLALLLLAALQWSCRGESVSTGSRPTRILNLEIVTTLRRLAGVICFNGVPDSVIETLKLPPPKRGDGALGESTLCSWSHGRLPGIASPQPFRFSQARAL